MFDYILGLPMHALVIHAVVVLVPLTSLVALAYAARPAWRPLLRWPLAVGGVISGVTAFVSAESGEALQRRVIAVRQSTTNVELLGEHTEWGDRAKIVCLVFMVLCLAAAWFVRDGRTSTPTATRTSTEGSTSGSAPSSTSGSTRSSTRLAETTAPAARSALELPLVVLLVVGALAALVVVAITGHAGAVVTWDGLG